jgi:prephenate dehydrogenase
MQKILDINITIIGLGLIGGSYAMAFKEINSGHVWGVDTNEDTLKKAIDMKIIDEGYCSTSAHIPIEKSDLVIIAVYPKAAAVIVQKNVENLKKGTIITDVLGIKGNNINVIQDILDGYDVEFIGGHPMAGKETSGVENASKDIFKEANYILTPTPKNKKATIAYMESLIKAIGFKNISIVTPEKHDEIIAITSQLPHVIALSLINSNGVDKSIKNFVGGSFKDESRVASINPELWCELFLSNKENLLKAIDEFQASMTSIKKALDNEDSEELKVIMKAAASKKGELN